MINHRRPGLSSVLPDVYIDLMEAIGTPRSLALAICFKNKQLFQNSHLLDVTPSNYVEIHSYRADAQSVAVFKKNAMLTQGKSQDELHSESIVRFFELEEINRQNNLRLASLKNFKDVSLLERVKRIIESVLGHQAIDFSSFAPLWSKGSTYSLPASTATIADKLDNNIDATPHALIYVQSVYEACPRLFAPFSQHIIVPGNRFSSVTKDWRKRRPISIEPLFNMLLQKNVGEFIRKRLRRVGIDINTQQDFHKWVLAHKWDDYATIDQSDASDRISHELVKQLLPPNWFTLLDRIRSRNTVINIDGIDVTVKLEKFASQGNGFIFELETLIFYAIAKATVDTESNEIDYLVSAYGDDVIVPVQFFNAVISSYELFGFSVNTEKSFGTGPFRESCGFDTFNGVEVRPLYLKEIQHGLEGKYQAANYVARLAYRSLHEYGFDSLYKRSWNRIISLIPEHRRYGGPEELADAVLLGHPYKGATNCGITRIKGLGRSFQPDQFRLPLGEYPLLAYIVFGLSDNGVLPRSAEFKTITADYVLYQESKQPFWL